VALIEQQKTSSGGEFLEKLIALTEAYHRRNYLLAKELGVSPNRLSQLLRGEQPSPTLEILVSRLHKEHLTKEPQKEAAYSQSVESLLAEWTEELGISREKFIEQCLRRFGQQTHDALVKLPPPQSHVVKPAESNPAVAQVLDKEAAHGATDEILQEERARRGHSPKPPTRENTARKPSPDRAAHQRPSDQPKPQGEAQGEQSSASRDEPQYPRAKKP
jgi:hypothetical protein